MAYLQVITAQAGSGRRNSSAVDLLARRMVSSVLLVQALGGGWDSFHGTLGEMTHGQ